jgi:peptidoglycan/LPS O-acetylase OafA/YrhL
LLTATDQAAPPLARRGSLTYLPGLDGLRALSVAAVLAYHADARWMTGGFLGVEVFFVISGYLITTILLNERRRSGRISLRRFYLRRARRLLPALVACVVVTLFVAFVLVPDEVRSLRDDAVAALAYVSNWHYVVADVPYFERFGRPSLLLHIWSLGVEEQFYLLWPLLLIVALAVGRRRLAAAVVVVGIAASTIWMAVLADPVDPGRVYYGTDTRAAGFLVGAALAMWWAPHRLHRSRARSSRWVLDAVGVAALAALIVILVKTSEFSLGLYRGGFLGVSIVSAVLIAVIVHPSPRLGRIMGMPLLVWIGLRSYGIYLWHFPIFMLTRPGFDVPAQPLWLIDLARVAATLIVAELSFRVIEMPIRNGALGRMWRRNRDETRARVVVIGTAFAVPLLAMGVVLAIPAPEGGRSAAALESSFGVLPLARTPSAADHLIGAPTEAITTTTTAAPAPPAGPPLVIGDSVVLGSAAVIQAVLGPGTVVDAAENREFDAAVPIVQAWIASGQPGPIVVHLGTNAPIRAEDLDAVITTIGFSRRLVLVNAAVPRRWEQPVNDVINAAIAAHPNIGLVDWHTIIAGNPGLLIDDHVHPNAQGRIVLAQAIQAVLAAP